MSETKKRTKNITRSIRLRKYQESYEACINKVIPKLPKPPRLSKSPSSRDSSKLVKLDKARRSSKSPSSRESSKLDKIDKPHGSSKSPSSKESKSHTKHRKASHKESKTSKESVKSCKSSPIVSRSPYKSYKSPKKKRPLNNYQQFVKDESQKDTYKHLSSSERMTAIGKAWKVLKI